jgi:phospholipase/lecithinase/hemolysin
MTRVYLQLLTFIFLACGQVSQQKADRPYSMLYVFGDSYSDIGAGYVDGNGPTAVAYLAQKMNIPFTFYGDHGFEGKGIDFAVSGAQTGESPGTRRKHGELLGRGMLDQVDEFVSLVKKGDIRFDPKQTMFFIAGGLNDKSLPTSETVANIEEQIALLHAAGATRFMVAKLPTHIEAFSAVASRLNPALAQIPEQMRLRFPDIQITESDWGAFFDRVLENPKAYGFTNLSDRCAGRALFDEDATPCSDPGSHYFYHQSHPSTAVHKVVGEMLYEEAMRQ